MIDWDEFERTRGEFKPDAMMNAIQKAAKALAQLSDAEWLRVKCDEERRHARGDRPENHGGYLPD